MAGDLLRRILALLSVVVFVFLISAGLLGTQEDPLANVLPAFVWIAWWVGLGFVCALVGNVWPALNPWAAVSALLCFLALFLGVCKVMECLEGRRAGAPRGAADVASSYVLTLVPIAIAYHLAHYLLLLMIEGQRLYGHISDPFGVGWDLFGTAGMTPDPTVVEARSLWLFSLFVIVAGHFIAVWLAHLAAHRTAGHGGRTMVAAQLPMLFLMVGYTVFSLWIIGQPIVEV